ncbi:hypothetical protein MLD38_000119 [Melastoma candidum]|uniref:Uncharacterized protein n=1 Tax=Melastoma candidum TaxID=119954 RepID=A0ACB9SAD1_9MYRT|nr:hypothetical protein MLD38_000119 [Melastoma candidum]
MVEDEAKVQAEVKRKRGLEREAARWALLQMEKTVEIDKGSSFLWDLEMLKAVVARDENLPSWADETKSDQSLEGSGSFKLGVSNPLEQLGLFMESILRRGVA